MHIWWKHQRKDKCKYKGCSRNVRHRNCLYHFPFYSVHQSVFNKVCISEDRGPLDILKNGVHEIRDSNLDYCIVYGRQDEFQPVCEDFNKMAERLKKSVNQIQQQEFSRKELVAGISHDKL